MDLQLAVAGAFIFLGLCRIKEKSMGVEIGLVYEGGLRCQAVHGPSGERLTTDAPKDHMGQGASFSPTDLVATALGTCMVTLMGIVAQKEHWDIAGTRARVVKEMDTGSVRRIGRLVVQIIVPAAKAGALSEADRKKLEVAARACPVKKSLHPEVETEMSFSYDG